MAVAMMEMSLVLLSLILSKQSNHPDEVKEYQEALSSVFFDACVT